MRLHDIDYLFSGTLQISVQNDVTEMACVSRYCVKERYFKIMCVQLSSLELLRISEGFKEIC